MKPSNVQTAIMTAVKASRPIFLWGAPGVGKSALVQQVAKALKRELVDVRTVLLESVDLRGIPHVDKETNVTNWAVPAFLPTSGKGILFLDELTTAPPSVQAACYQLVLDRALGEYRLPDGWEIIAAGNRLTDRANTYAMPTPLANRFIHLDVEANLDDWIGWAFKNGIDEQVIAFMRFRPELLHDFDTKQRCFPTPRSWEFASRLLTTGIPKEIEFDLLSGTVGEGPATEFLAFARTWRELPDLDQILTAPNTVKAPEQVAAKYAVTTALANRATRDNFRNIMTYMDKLPREFQTLLVKDAVRANQDIAETSAFSEWVTRNASTLL